MADSPRPSSLQRTSMYASLLRFSGALSATGGDIFDQPYKSCFFSKLLEDETYKQVGFLFTKDLLQHLTAGVPVPIVFLHGLLSL